jgi:integrase/recombinase XerD
MTALSKEELRALLTAARARRERDYLMILVAYCHGLRASEVVHLKRKDIGDDFITVQRLKGSKKTTQPLLEHPEALFNERHALTEYTRNLHNEQPLFPISRVQFWRLVQRHAAAAGLPKHKRHPHMLKHTTGRHGIASANIRDVQEWLGHASLASTGVYLDRTPEEVATAMRGALGRFDFFDFV